jgi:exopolysaccharide production protein ExoZ
MDTGKAGRMEFIQGARGIAALLVVLWHASRYLGPYGTGVGANFAPGGVFGVDLFFLVSGFIMVVTTRDNDGSLRYFGLFLTKRFSRIWPPYAIASVVMVLVFDRERLADATYDLLKALVFLPLGGGGAAPPTFGAPPLSVGWTLNYEAYFYAIFAIALCFGRLSGRALSTWIALTLVALPLLRTSIPSIQHALVPEYRSPYVNYLDLVSSPLITLFMVGVGIGHLYLSKMVISNKFIATLLVFVSLAAVVYQMSGKIYFRHGLIGAGISLIPAFAIICIASKTIQISCPKWLLWIGGMSYSLYLWHPMVQQLFDVICRAVGRPEFISGISPFIVTTLLSVMAASVSHRYLEVKLSDTIRHFLVEGIWRLTNAKRALDAAAPRA